MDIKQLKYFLQVAHARSFSRAAEQIRIAQPAVSRQVSQLERELGMKLLDRSRRGVQPTEVGRRLEERAQAIIRQLDQLKAEMVAHADAPSGDAALGIPPSLRTMLTIPLAAQYHKRYPQVRLRIIEDTTIGLSQVVAAGQVDVALISTVEPQSILSRLSLLSESMCLIAPRERGLDLRKPVSITELSGLPLIQTPYPNSLRVLVERAMAKKKIAPDVRVEANTLLMIDLVRGGLGYTILPYCAVHEHLRAGSISAAPIAGLRISWILAHSKERPLTTASQKLIAHLREQAKDLIARKVWKTAVLDC